MIYVVVNGIHHLGVTNEASLFRPYGIIKAVAFGYTQYVYLDTPGVLEPWYFCLAYAS